jgi:Acyltransferase family
VDAWARFHAGLVVENPSAPQERIHYVDWLRVLIVYGIALYHISLVFAATTWLVSNRQHIFLATLFSGFTFTWGIPAMFLIAGAGSWFALRSRSAAAFIKERFLRLVLPLIAGVALLTPLQRFLVSHNPPPGLSALPGFYSSLFTHIHLDQALQWVGLYSLHLWFLAYLFAVSMICLPAIVWMKSSRSTPAIQKLLQLSMRRGGVLIFALPLCVVQGALRWQIGQYEGWADILGYVVVFILGALFISDRRFEECIRRDIVITLATGIAGALALGAMVELNIASSIPWRFLFGLIWGLNTWCWLVAVLYLGIRWLNVPNRAITYASESALPFYVIHHPIVLGAASFVVTWSIGAWAKFGVITFIVYGGTLLVYEFGVRRWRLMRVLFGLKPQHRPGGGVRKDLVSPGYVAPVGRGR